MPHDLPGRLASVPLLGKLGLKHLLGFGFGEYSTRTTLLLALLVDLLAHHCGLSPAIGAYIAGLAARYTANFDWRESLLIGFGMPVSARNCPAAQQNQ